MRRSKASGRKLFVPEVVQTSAMDCGPACLKALLEGHGIHASYGRLREACHTDVDGSSIDALEQVACELGLDARQVMVPVDHLLLREAALLPALVVVRQPSGMTHFVVVWSVRAGLVQIMDPATGRRWSTQSEFANELHVHEMPVPVEAWCEWAAAEDFQVVLRVRLAELGFGAGRAARLVASAAGEVGWRPIAALDAAARMVATVVRGNGLRRGKEAASAVEAFYERARDESAEPTAILPAECWTVRPAQAGDANLVLRGAVLVSIAGVRERSEAEEDVAERAPSADLALALSEPPARPGRELLALLRADGLLAPAVLVSLLALSAGAVLVEALLFRSLLGIGGSIAIPEQRLGAIVALCVFAGLLLALELPIAQRSLAIGRRLELRLRTALLGRIARLDDRYFRSRLVSDMAERAHRLHELRVLPELGSELLRAVFGVVATTVGIVVLAPTSAALAIACAAAAVLLPWAGQHFLAEGDLRLRNHSGALLRFHLDALLGIVPLRAHAAGRSVRRGHDGLMVEWTRAGLGLQRRVVAVEAVQSVASLALAAWLVLDQSSRAGTSGSALLLAYWALSLPVLGQQVGLCARQYPTQRSITLRFLEMLGSPAGAEGDASPTTATGDRVANGATRGVTICMEGVSVQAGGHTILTGIDLEIAAGSHVAIVGPSGAGKSSLLGLLLGWHRPATGSVRIDGLELDAPRLECLRRETAWVDPSVQLWNRSLFDNLTYGANGRAAQSLGPTIERARLGEVLERLPNGMQSELGEGGTLVSGGEGQRVRVGRACVRAPTRLAVFDEPLRGLAREQRAELLAALRELWRESTLVCVTHDVGETLSFERVIVVEGGRIVEQGSPQILAGADSRYAALLAAEQAVRSGLWKGASWRRMRLEGGRLVAEPGEVAS